MLNSIVIMGCLTDEPEFRTTQKMISIATFTLACERDFNGQDNTRQTDFVPVTAWRGNAEFVKKHFHKGDMIIVNGRLQTHMSEDEEGRMHDVVEVNAKNIYFGNYDPAETEKMTNRKKNKINDH